MLSSVCLSPFPEKLHKKGSPIYFRTSPDVDLEFYKYDFTTFILVCQLRLFRMGGVIVRSSHPRQK